MRLEDQLLNDLSKVRSQCDEHIDDAKKRHQATLDHPDRYPTGESERRYLCNAIGTFTVLFEALDKCCAMVANTTEAA